MQSSIGRSDWFDWTSKCHIFFSIENNPSNVHIERNLRSWRFWKFKNFFILVHFCIQNGIWRFICFLQNRPTDIDYIGFSECPRVNRAIFDILEHKPQRIHFYGFWRFLPVFRGFLSQKLKNPQIKIFKKFQRFDFPKMSLKYDFTLNKRGKCFFKVSRHVF